MLSTTMLIGLSVLALPVLKQLTFNDNPQQIFSNSSDVYQQYLRFANRFPAEQHDVPVLISGPILSDRGMRTLVELTDELRQLDPVSNVYAITTEPSISKLLSGVLNGQANARKNLFERMSNADYLPSRLVSTKQDTTVFNLALHNAYLNNTKQLSMDLTQIRSVLDHNLADTEFTWDMAGFPTLRVALQKQIRHDLLLFGGLAVLFSGIVAWLMFHSILVVLASMLGPVIGVLWTYGLMAALGLQISVLTQMVGVFILVVGYSDAIHLTHHIDRLRAQGLSLRRITLDTYRLLGPPCLLTSLTTAAGFLSLSLSKSLIIREFGLVCAAGTLLGFLAVMLTLPLMVFVIFRVSRRSTTDVTIVNGGHVYDQANTSATTAMAPPSLPVRVSVNKSSFPTLPAKYDYLLIACGAFLSAALLIVAVQVKPDYTLGENLPAKNSVLTTLDLADTKLGGVLPLHVMLEWNTTPAPTIRQMMSDIRTVQNALNTASSTQYGHSWVSVVNTLRYAPGIGTANRLRLLPKDVVERLLNQSSPSALISTTVKKSSSRELNQQLLDINTLIATLDIEDTVNVHTTGFLALVSHSSQQMIGDLARSLSGAVFIILLITIALFKSLKVGLISFIPNIAPVCAIAALLVALGEPIRYSSVVVFSICLGLAIDDTVHLIMRFRHYKSAGFNSEEAAHRATNEVGYVLLLTTGVMVAGFGALLISTTPTLVWMGLLSIVAMLVAVVADLSILPALLRRLP